MKNGKTFILLLVLLLRVFSPATGHPEDTPVTRSTLAHLRGVRVVVEYMQPNLGKYARQAGLSDTQIQQEVEGRLQAEGLRIMSSKKWLDIPGRPILYIRINTHLMDRFWHAYDVKLELKQLVHLDADVKVKTMADTWSINITGVVNIGNLSIIRNDVMVLVERFIQAYRSAYKGTTK